MSKLVGLHEVAHHIVARELGFAVEDIEVVVTFEGGHRGGATVVLGIPLYEKNDVIDYLRKRVQILFAGVLAQKLHNGKVDVDAAIDETYVKEWAEADFSKARELVNLLRNISYPNDDSDDENQEHLDQIWKELINKSVAIVEDCSDMIIGISGHFLEMDEMPGTTGRRKEYKKRLEISFINTFRNVIERYGPF